MQSTRAVEVSQVFVPCSITLSIADTLVADVFSRLGHHPQHP
jgi:hypothetical protein